MINAYNPQPFLFSPENPPQFLSITDQNKGIKNHVFRPRITLDQWLHSWLQSTLSSSIVTRIDGWVCNHSLWDRIHAYFQNLIWDHQLQVLPLV